LYKKIKELCPEYGTIKTKEIGVSYPEQKAIIPPAQPNFKQEIISSEEQNLDTQDFDADENTTDLEEDC
jgi:hypothetical protein